MLTDYQWNNRDESGREHIDGFSRGHEDHEIVHHEESIIKEISHEEDTYENNINQGA